jgi:hypothetical protein
MSISTKAYHVVPLLSPFPRPNQPRGKSISSDTCLVAFSLPALSILSIPVVRDSDPSSAGSGPKSEIGQIDKLARDSMSLVPFPQHSAILHLSSDAIIRCVIAKQPYAPTYRI